MSLDGEAIRHLATLARLQLQEDQADRFASELARVLSYVDEITTMEAPPAISAPGVLQGRADVPHGCRPEPLLAASEGRQGGFVAVPRVIASE